MGHGRRRRDEEEDESEEMDSDMEELEVGDEEGDEEQQPGKRRPIYNTEALHEALEDFAWTEEQAFEESLVVTCGEAGQVENVDDDLARELAFYNQALSAATEAIKRFESSGTPWRRPLDYYAEMVKSDNHMAKVKEQLMFEQKQVELAEERRKQREAKLYGKQVQQQRLREKQQEKKRQIENISKLRKQREKSGYQGELDMDSHLKNMDREGAGAPRGGRGPQGQRDRPQPNKFTPNKKRQLKNAKFGHGGPKKLSKQNDASSAADMSGYRPGRFKESFGGVHNKRTAPGQSPGGSKGGKGGFKGGKGGPGGPKGGVKKRPGKQARMGGRKGGRR